MSTSLLESHTEIDETLEPKKVNVVGTIWGIIVMGILATGDKIGCIVYKQKGELLKCIVNKSTLRVREYT
ncbi:hypothetical protein H1D32_11415 [Anaerobacillus sp. CMMVII]|uniref:hypothetical protein n=1 Tax=Anaerobacillus sp. CMMVII TaxID=2755588 RepID=UPI0021B72615|nr:hypothetical protein [Anaerobacillus sp. CMMVII]MCT8138305.1 hypothetical protein [Anaerobacillus sp. CMMVII]